MECPHRRERGNRISSGKISRQPFCRTAAHLFACLWLTTAGAACVGHTSLYMVPWQSRWLEPGREPLITIDGCSAAWSENKTSKPQIVISKSWPMGSAEVLVVVDLDKMPTGRGKQYKLSQGRLRAFWNGRWGSAYFQSYAGTIAIERQGSAVLKLAIRCCVKQWNRALLGGWSGPSRLMLAASGWARRDEQIVRATSAKFEKLTGTRCTTQASENSVRAGK